jgi:hypothetical protein
MELRAYELCIDESKLFNAHAWVTDYQHVHKVLGPQTCCSVAYEMSEGNEL